MAGPQSQTGRAVTGQEFGGWFFKTCRRPNLAQGGRGRGSVFSVQGERGGGQASGWYGQGRPRCSCCCVYTEAVSSEDQPVAVVRSDPAGLWPDLEPSASDSLCLLTSELV